MLRGPPEKWWRVPRERAHVPPNGKAEKSSTQKCGAGRSIVPRCPRRANWANLLCLPWLKRNPPFVPKKDLKRSGPGDILVKGKLTPAIAFCNLGESVYFTQIMFQDQTAALKWKKERFFGSENLPMVRKMMNHPFFGDPNETGFCWGRQYVRGSHLDLVFAGRGYVYYKEEQSKDGISELNGDQTSRTMPTFLPHFINHGELE